MVSDAALGLLGAGIAKWGTKAVKYARVKLQIRQQKRLKTYYDKMKTPPGVKKPPVDETSFYAIRQVETRQIIASLEGSIGGQCNSTLWSASITVTAMVSTSNIVGSIQDKDGTLKEGLQEDKLIEDNTRVIDALKTNSGFEEDPCCEVKE